MSKLYERLIAFDVLGPIDEPLSQGKIKFELDGKLVLNRKLDQNSPWLFHKAAPDRDCDLWHGIYLKYYHIIPKACYSCWKVVFKPETLKQLFAIVELQKELNLPSKCGIERRPFVSSSGYAAFWYCPLDGSLDTAREVWKVVNRRTKELFNLGSFLKRACTEMENWRGASDQWKRNEREDIAEKLLNSLYVPGPNDIINPAPSVVRVQRLWIEYAWQRNDPTVWEFAEKESFPAGPVAYERSEHKSEDFPLFRREVGNGRASEVS